MLAWRPCRCHLNHFTCMLLGVLKSSFTRLCKHTVDGEAAEGSSFTIVVAPRRLQMQVLFNVVDGGLRPDIPESCPPRYRSLVESCWAQRPDRRCHILKHTRCLAC